ncbi:DUF1573 domain-containing protein [Gaoshiqia sp. Z1-71]|uniref:DUF1573 domain-containing protein n=1 Tax=Gaoshiqia hydrogeniformans TaxID=3290090 RepID=UPI003BF83423
MRLLGPMIALLFAFGCQHSAKNNDQQSGEKQGTAKFVFQEELHNFGSLQAGEIVAYSFQFTNIGNSKLFIKDAVSDCGCISVIFPKEPVNPGETGYIEVIFSSAGEVGKVYKEIRINSNAEPGEMKLMITANVQHEMINIYSKN